MTIPADFHLKAGYYKNKTTGQVAYYCNCSSQPAHLTLRTIAANRANYEVFPPKAAAPITVSATFTLANGAQS